MSRTNENFVTAELKTRLEGELRRAGFSEELVLYLVSEVDLYARTSVAQIASVSDDAAEKTFAAKLKALLPSDLRAIKDAEV